MSIVLLGGGLTLIGTAPASAAPACVTPHGPTQTFAAGTQGDYTPPAGSGFVEVTAIGGAGAAESNDNAAGGLGAEVKSGIPSATLRYHVATDASGAVGGKTGVLANGGKGDSYNAGGAFVSGGGGGVTQVDANGIEQIYAAGGGGAGYGNAGANAATSPAVSKAAGAVTNGADGSNLADPSVSGHGGGGGSTVPGAGGAATPGYGAGDGHSGVGRTGGDAFTETGAAGNVGAGGGGGGFQGGGGGGGGGWGGSGGAGSSYAVAAYKIGSATAAPALTIENILKPVFSSAAAASFTQEKSGSFTVCAPAADDPAITEVGALPPGVTFVDNGDGTATISGKPTGGAGKFTLTLTSTGLGGVTTQSFVLTVDPSDQLAVTGTDAAPAGLLAIVLLLGGGAALWLRRRRGSQV